MREISRGIFIDIIRIYFGIALRPREQTSTVNIDNYDPYGPQPVSLNNLISQK